VEAEERQQEAALRRLDGDAATRLHEQAEHQVEAVLRAVGDQHLALARSDRVRRVTTGGTATERLHPATV